MCFSASASFIAGTALSAVGVVTIKKARQKVGVPFAMIPLLFGVQQITEGLVWLSLRFDAAALNAAATFMYSLFSHVLWPIFVPFAIMSLETVPWRKKVISLFQLVGIAVGLYLLYFLIRSPITSHVVNKGIVYDSPHFYIFPVLAFYFLATCVSCFFSSHKLVNLFGGAVLLSALLAYWLYAASFISVWCFFAALLSFIIFLYFYLCFCRTR